MAGVSECIGYCSKNEMDRHFLKTIDQLFSFFLNIAQSAGTLFAQNKLPEGFPFLTKAFIFALASQEAGHS